MKKRKPWFALSNVRTGILTTILGLVLIGISIYFLLAPDYSALEGLSILILGLALLGIDDPRNHTPAAVVLLLLVLSSCVTYTRCVDKFGVADTVKVTIEKTVPVITTVTVPGDSVQVDINIDSMLLARFDDTLQVISQAGRAKISFWKDKYNNILMARADCDEQIVTDTVFQTVTVEADCPGIRLDPDKHQPWPRRLWEGFKNASAYILLAVLFIFLIRRLFKL